MTCARPATEPRADDGGKALGRGRGVLLGLPFGGVVALIALGSCDSRSDNPPLTATTTYSVSADCVVDDDCPIGQLCSIGLCVQGCRPDGSRCTAGEICVDMRCVPQPLDAGADTGSDGATADADATVGDCPADMVQLSGTYCMDRYEAARPNATDLWPGDDESVAVSRLNVLPWYPVTKATAAAACAAAGKRLCSVDEFALACSGAADRRYAYGNDYDPTLCNGSDTFCQCGAGSACQDVASCPYPHCFNSPPAGSTTPAAGCGALLHLLPTGSMPGCVSPEGLWDLNGNVWELVDDETAEGQYRGGAFNCIDSVSLHQCAYVGVGISAKGFRCCAGL